VSEANLRRLNRSFEGLSFLYYSWPRRRMRAQQSQTRRKWNIGKGMSHLLTERLEPGSQKVERSWMRNSATAAHIPSLPSGRRKSAATDTNKVLKALGWREGPRQGMGPAADESHARHTRELSTRFCCTFAPSHIHSHVPAHHNPENTH